MSVVSTPSVPDNERPRRRWLRAFDLLLFALIGAVVARGRPDNGFFYDSTSEIVTSFLVGLLVALVFLAIVGTLGYGIARLRGSDKTWSGVTFGLVAMIVTLVLLLAGTAGREAQQQEDLDKAKPNPSGSQIEQQKANIAAQQWGEARRPYLKAVTTALLENQAFVKALEAQGNSPAVRRQAASIQKRLLGAELGIAQLPTASTDDLAALDTDITKAIAVAAGAYADYVAGLKANARSGIPLQRDEGALALIDSGDRKFNEALRRLERSGSAPSP